MAGSFDNGTDGAREQVPSVARRTVEIGTAVAVALVGVVVVVESLAHDIGWK